MARRATRSSAGRCGRTRRRPSRCRAWAGPPRRARTAAASRRSPGWWPARRIAGPAVAPKQLQVARAAPGLPGPAAPCASAPASARPRFRPCPDSGCTAASPAKAQPRPTQRGRLAPVAGASWARSALQREPAQRVGGWRFPVHQAVRGAGCQQIGYVVHRALTRQRLHDLLAGRQVHCAAWS